MFHFGPGPKQKDYNTDTDLIRSEIGIIVDGNKSALGASTGQYVILKNSTITGKTDGLYKAAQAIPANTAIDGSYLTAVSGGLGAEVASANSSISTLNGKMSNNLNVDKMRFVVARNSDRFSFDVGSSDGATAFVFSGNQGVCAYFALTFGASPAVDARSIGGTTTWTISQSGSTVTLVRSDGTMWGMACLIVALH